MVLQYNSFVLESASISYYSGTHKPDTSHCKSIVCMWVYQQVLLRVRTISQELPKGKMGCKHLSKTLLVPHKATEKPKVPNCCFCTVLPTSFVLPRLTCLLKADHQLLATFFLACVEVLYHRKLNT